MIRFMAKPIVGLALALAASCLGCSEDDLTASEATQASAVINPTEGNQAQGMGAHTSPAACTLCA